MSVKARTILLVSIIFLLLSATYFYLGYQLNRAHLQEKIAELESTCQREVHAVIQNIFQPYAKRIESLATCRPALVEAFARRDRDLLARQTLPAYLALQRENPYLQAMPFILPDGENFLRMHAPELFGDDQGLIRPMVKAMGERKSQLLGFEVGRHGAFFRIMQPLFANGDYLGAVEFGILARQASAAVEEKLKLPVAEFYLAEEWQKADQQTLKGKRYGKYTLLAPDDSPLAQLPPTTSLEEKDGGPITLGGHTYILCAYPVFTDYLGHPIGGIVLLQAIDSELAQGQHYLTQSLLLTAVLLTVALAILFIGFGGLVDKLENSEKVQSKLVTLLEEKVVLLKEQEEKLTGYQSQLETLVRERTKALEQSQVEVKTLRGFLPICASCKKIRNDQGYWTQIESYISDHSEAEFTHSICPPCAKELYPGLYPKKKP